MIRREEVKSKVKVLDIIAGDPTHILIAQAAARPDGTTRTITQKLRVLDTDLFFRLRATVKKGDEIEATIVTELTKDGYKTFYATSLFDFQAIPSKTED